MVTSHFTNLSVVCAPEGDAPPTGLPLHPIPSAHVNPGLMVKIVQLYPFLKADLKCRILQEVFMVPPSNQIFYFYSFPHF